MVMQFRFLLGTFGNFLPAAGRRVDGLGLLQPGESLGI